MINEYDFQYICILEDEEKPDPLYGMEQYTLTKDMFKALWEGKRLYMTVNDEYAVVLKLGEWRNK